MFTTVFVDTRLWKTKQRRKRFQNFHQSYMLSTDQIEIHQKCSLLQISEPMMSKVQPAADYWTVDQENLGTRLCYFWCTEKQREGWQNSFKNGEIFWMNNTAIMEFGFRRIWRILQLSEGVNHLGIWPLWILNTLLVCMRPTVMRRDLESSWALKPFSENLI